MINKKNMILALFCGLFANPASGTLQKITLCTDNNFWYPFVYMQNGQVQGLHIDIINQALITQNCVAEYKPMSWADCQDAARFGIVDGIATISYDPARAKELEENIRRAGLSDIVQVVSGDAFQQIPKLPGTFDFVFLDAWKKDYKRFFDMVYPRLDARGLFLAHNVVNKKNEMGDFLDAVLKHPSLWTTIVSPSGEGMSVSMRVK